MKKSTTRRTLLLSLLSLMLCMSMLVGTTFAWFTDSVSSGKNTLTAGNLDVALDYTATPDVDSSWKTVEGATDLFDPNALWEPGHTEVVYLRVSNLGSLALKYQLAMKIERENGGINKDGDPFLLSSYLKYAVVDYTAKMTREEAIAAADASALGLTDYCAGSTLGKTESKTVALVVYMPSTVNDEANYKTGTTPPSIELGISVQATQMTAESDSFGPSYDGDAWIDGMLVFNEADLRAAVASGSSVILADDITLTESIVVNAVTRTFAMRSAPAPTVINLNGKSITIDAAFDSAAEKASSAIVNNGSLILMGEGTVKATNNYTIRNYGTMMIDGATVENGIMNFSDLTVESGSFSNSRTGKHVIYGNNATLTINGGTFYNGNPGNAAIFSYAGEVTINGGEFSIADGTATLGWTSCLLDAQGNAAYAIYGGTVNGEIRDYNKNTVVYGGTFSHASAKNFLADDCAAADNGDGSFTVLPKLEGVTMSKHTESGLYWNGNTAANKSVYYIFNASDLKKAASYFVGLTKTNEANRATLELMADIDMAGETWTAWDVMWIDFVGNGYAISNLSIAEGWRVGLFGYLGASTVSGLTLENVSSAGAQVGTFAGSVEGVTFTDCYLKGANSVVYKPYSSESYNETYGGIGAIVGVLYGSSINAEITSGTTVFLNKEGLETNCEYHDNFTGYLQANSGTVVNNGKIALAVTVSTDTDFSSSVSSGAESVKLSAGNYTMPEPDLRGKALTVSGTKDTVIDLSAVDARDQFVTGATVVFDGVTLNFGKVNYMGLANTASLTYRNCTINGLQFLFGENVTFENCTLNANGAEHCVWTYGARNVSFKDCDFIYGDRGINCYSDNDVVGGKQTVTFEGCTFSTENTASEGAVEINSHFFSVGIEVNLVGCTAPAYGEMAYVSRWDDDHGAKTTINIQ